MSKERERQRFPSDNDMDEQDAKKMVLARFPEAKENPYDHPFCRPGLIFAPFCGGWCKIGENWQDAKKSLPIPTEEEPRWTEVCDGRHAPPACDDCYLTYTTENINPA